MNIVVLFFIVLFAVSAVIVTGVVVNIHKRQREAEEEHRKEEQKAKHRVEEKERLQLEEKRRKAEEEAKQKSKEREEERRKTEKEYRESKKKRKQIKEGVQQKTEKRRSGGRRPPEERGGGPRGPKEHPQKEQTPPTKRRSLKPEIVCWNERRRWIVGIEVPEELGTLNVIQNGELLEQDDTDECLYRLNNVEGTLKVSWNGEEKDIPLLGPRMDYLVFKMRKNWNGPGRQIRYSTTGFYLVIVPEEWRRDEEVSGPAPVEPDNVQLEGSKVHFFHQEQHHNTVIGFIAANGERIRVESGGSHFELVGKEIGDNSDEMGPLFAEHPPRIRTLDEKGWSNVGVIVVGEEGSGRNRWRTHFVPQVDVKEQAMSEKVANRRGGWYFVRIYDKENNLLESMDFRFLTALKHIRMESSDLLPGPNGYDNVTAQFLHQTDCKVELIDGDTQHALEIRREDERTIVTVPPKPDCDKTLWRVRKGNAEIKVTLLVERIWWAVGVMGVVPTDWADKPVILSRKHFTATSDKALCVRLPRTRLIRKIDMDFDRAKRRSFPVEVEKKEIAIPLRDFCDAKEIENRQEESRMMIWVQLEGAKLDETVVGKVPADQPTPVKPKQRKIQIVPGAEKPCLLQATVKCRRGGRKGKGFSRSEIIEAGITVQDVKRLHIPYDKRRKTSHSWNVESLKCITER